MTNLSTFVAFGSLTYNMHIILIKLLTMLTTDLCRGQFANPPAPVICWVQAEVVPLSQAASRLLDTVVIFSVA